jgi:segregation and condensation protein B
MHTDTTQKLHALLFVHGDAMERSNICELLAITDEQLSESIAQLNQQLETTPFQISDTRSGVIMVTRPEFGEFLQHIKQSISTSPLSKSALETLTIILYKPKITKAEIDSVRGVNSTLSLRNLIMRGLIAKSVQGGVTQFESTSDTLRHLGIEHIEQLPHYAEFTESFENNRTEAGE